MFTGIIEAVGTVKTVKTAHGGRIISVDLGALAQNTELGQSIAINGVCLTVSRLSATIADFDVSPETLAKSAMDTITASAKVNLERAIGTQGRFGGHFVQGHIDGIAKIIAIEKKGDFAEIKFSAPPELLEEMVIKGSVAVDGVSLTVAAMDEKSFTLSLIPTTSKETTLGRAKIGDKANIETDIIIKTVIKQMQKMLPQNQPLTVDKLRELGF
jgi:riboflavin synthase